MEWAAAVLVMIPTSLVFLIAFMSFTRKTSHSKLPPGNMGMPFIGETFSFIKPHSPTALGDFMEHHISRFGKVFVSNLMGRRTIFSADPELNRFILKNEMKLFGPGWPKSFEKLTGKTSISLMVGDIHKEMRSSVLDFLSGERLRTIFLQDAHQFASDIISSWKEGHVISAKDEATKFSLYIMVKRILSMSPGDHGIEKLAKEYDLFIRGFVCIPLNLPGTTFYNALKSRDYIFKIIKQEMEVRMGKRSSGDKGIYEDDFLGWLTKNTDYSSEKICDMVLGVLFAGHDTTSRTISLLIYFLESCPKAVVQLREEHLQVVRSKVLQGGENKLTVEDFKKMEFTKCVINETLRLGNIAGYIQRKATTDVEFKGYSIPKDCHVLLHLKAVHLDPSLFDGPEQFNPWRWLSSSVIKMTSCYMPFGGGVRLCPGAELAKLETIVFLHHLILKYDWELVEPDHPMSIPFIEFPKGLPIKVRAKSVDL